MANAGNCWSAGASASNTKKLQLPGACAPVHGTTDAMSMSGAAEVTSFGPFTVSVATGNPSEITWSGGNPPCFAK